MERLNQQELFEKIDILPLEIKIEIVDKILSSMMPLDISIDKVWIEEANKRMVDVKSNKVSLVDGEEVFKRVFERLK